jgi:hypothetical protein
LIAVIEQRQIQNSAFVFSKQALDALQRNRVDVPGVVRDEVHTLQANTTSWDDVPMA